MTDTARRPRGFTLVEVMIAMTLLAVIMGSLYGVIVRSQREYVRQREGARSQESLRLAEGSIGAILRSAGADPYDRGLALLDPDPLEHGEFDNLRTVSDFNPPDGEADDLYEDVQIWLEADSLMVRWGASEEEQALIYPVSSLTFWYYDAAGNVITDAALMDDATKVRFRVETPADQRNDSEESREAWVYLRNRG